MFITLEGLDACGKGSQAKLFVAYLARKNIPVTYLREPGSTSAGEKIRSILVGHNKLSDVAEFLLFSAARAQNVTENILPALKKGNLVFSERFTDSSLVYQGFARGLGFELVKTVNAIATYNTTPDRVYYLKISPEESVRRMSLSGKKDRFESLPVDFHKKLYQGYEQIIADEPDRFVVIDGEQPLEDVHKAIVKDFEAFYSSSSLKN